MNFADTYHRAGISHPWPVSKPPVVIGFEGVGIIDEIGQDAKNFKIGDKVAYGIPPLGSYSEFRNYPADKLLHLPVELDDKEVATLFERNDLISSSVINENGKLIGRITIDDVVDVIREDADQNLLGMAGVAEDTFAPPGRAAKSRVFWLSMNLVTAFIAASTINIFQDVIVEASSRSNQLHH